MVETRPAQGEGEGKDITWDQDPPADTQSHLEDSADEVGDQLTLEPQEQLTEETLDQVTSEETAEQSQQSQAPTPPVPRRTGRERRQPRKLLDYHLGTLCYAGAVLSP